MCCRIYSVASAPYVEFKLRELEPSSDMLCPLENEVKNLGQIQTDIEIAVLRGDAMIVPLRELPQFTQALAL